MSDAQIEIDPEAMRLIALTYRTHLRAGKDSAEAFSHTLAAYRQMWPHHTEVEARDVVADIVRRAGELAPDWLYETSTAD